MKKNSFLTQVVKKDTVTENGAVSNSTTGASLVDQFGKASAHRGRALDAVFADQGALHTSTDNITALKFALYLRSVTRQPKSDLVDTEKPIEVVHKGSGNRDESLKRLLYIAYYHPQLFNKNMWMIPVTGRYKDLFDLIVLDRTVGNNSLDEDTIFEFLATISANSETDSDLVKKWMPRIRSNNKCKTESAKVSNQIAKDFAKFLGLNPKDYRQLKSGGKAHTWQQLISNGDFSSIEWNKVSGHALKSLVSGKFLDNQSLQGEFLKWLDTKGSVNFNGYPYELLNIWTRSRKTLIQKHTSDKQFQSLIDIAKKDASITENVWCALDTSGSMTVNIGEGNLTAYDVCVSLGIYFSSLNEGAFKQNVIMFDNKSTVKQLSGKFTDMVDQIQSSSIAWGGTNFQSVVDEIVRVRTTNPAVPLEDYPTTLLVVSDMQFNPSGGYGRVTGDNKTNFEEMKTKLEAVFPAEWVAKFKAIWWDCTARKSDFPATLDDSGCYFMSGFDGAIVNLILGRESEDQDPAKKPEPVSMEKIVDDALNQPLLQLVEA